MRFYGPVNPMGSCWARSVYLTTRLLGRLSPLSSCNQYCAHSFARNWQLPFFNQWKGENDRSKYFVINLHERILPTSAGVEPATAWSPVGRRIQLSRRGRQWKCKVGLRREVPVVSYSGLRRLFDKKEVLTFNTGNSANFVLWLNKQTFEIQKCHKKKVRSLLWMI